MLPPLLRRILQHPISCLDAAWQHHQCSADKTPASEPPLLKDDEQGGTQPCSTGSGFNNACGKSGRRTSTSIKPVRLIPRGAYAPWYQCHLGRCGMRVSSDPVNAPLDSQAVIPYAVDRYSHHYRRQDDHRSEGPKHTDAAWQHHQRKAGNAPASEPPCLRR